jgi:RNA polymerase sigma factor (sigma-70 family)
MRQGGADRLTEEDRRRFEEHFLPHLDAAYDLARWIIQHDQDARDVVQDAYIRAFKGFLRFRGGNSRAWFLTIVLNTAYDWLNRHAREEELTRILHPFPVLSICPDDESSGAAERD